MDYDTAYILVLGCVLLAAYLVYMVTLEEWADRIMYTAAFIITFGSCLALLAGIQYLAYLISR